MYIVPAVPSRLVPVMATLREIIGQSWGQSPGLAGRIREWLSAQFDPEWALRLAQLGTARRPRRAERHAPPELARRTAATIEEAGWLR
jgi:hypothetical protein